eukprot:SAG11_NODE_1081_length_5956_cov_14.482506_4_plen_169_part_00
MRTQRAQSAAEDLLPLQPRSRIWTPRAATCRPTTPPVLASICIVATTRTTVLISGPHCHAPRPSRGHGARGMKLSPDAANDEAFPDLKRTFAAGAAPRKRSASAKPASRLPSTSPRSRTLRVRELGALHAAVARLQSVWHHSQEWGETEAADSPRARCIWQGSSPLWC